MTITDIFNQIVAAKEADPQLASLDNTSNVSIWRLWAWITATVQWTIYQLFEAHKQEVQQIISEKNPDSITYLIKLIKDFQYGFELVPFQKYYDNSGIDPAIIEASKIVKYVAIVELRRGLLVKVAGMENGELAPLAADYIVALNHYLSVVKPYGVPLKVINSPADSLKLSLKVYYDPEVLTATGARRDGTDPAPIPKAIEAFLKDQPFNGRFVLERLVAALKAVKGITIPHVVSAQANYAATPYQDIEVFYLPNSGYLRFVNPSDLEIQFFADV